MCYAHIFLALLGIEPRTLWLWCNLRLSPNVCFHSCSLYYCICFVVQVQWMTKTSQSVLIRVLPDCTLDSLGLPSYYCKTILGFAWLVGWIGTKINVWQNNGWICTNQMSTFRKSNVVTHATCMSYVICKHSIRSDWKLEMN